MQGTSTGGRFGRWVFLGAGLIIIMAGLKLASALIVPFLLAAFIALMCSIPLFWLNKKGLPNGVSVLIIVFGVLGIGTVIGVAAGSSIRAFSGALPEYQQSLQTQFDGVLTELDGFGLDVSAYRESIADMINPGAAMGIVTGALKKTGGVLANGFMIILTVIFILLEAVSMPQKLRRVLPDSEKTFQGFQTFLDSVKQYLVIKTLISAVTGLAAGICMAVIGVDFPILWGLTAFALNFVPTIGSIIAAVPPILLGMVQYGPRAALSVGGCYLVINVVMGNIVEPKVAGEGLGLSALVVFLSLVFWGWLLGPVGMLLSVPLTMIVKIACESQESTKHIGILLGPAVPKPKEKSA